MGLQDESDEALMRRYRGGDAAAFGVLYARHRAPLYRFILRQVRQAALAEELFQEVWVAVIRGRGRYRVRARFTTLLYRIARSRVIDSARARSRRERGLGTVSQRLTDELETGEATVEQQVDGRRQVERLAALVEALPPEQREAFLLREEAGLEVTEIARVTGVGRETAKSRLRYAVARLRAALEPEDPLP